MGTDQVIYILRQLSRGEILKRQPRRFFLRGDRVSPRLARKLVRNNLVEPPPDLFAPEGGRITTAGLAELQRLENTHD